MASYSKNEQQYHRRKIQQLWVINKSMSLREMQKNLDANGIHLDLHYIGKIREKVIAHQARGIDKFLLTVRLGEHQLSRMEVLQHAWDILLNTTDNEQKLSAARLILNEEDSWTRLLIGVGLMAKDDPRAKDVLPLADAQKVESLINFLRASMVPNRGEAVRLPDYAADIKSDANSNKKPDIPNDIELRQYKPTIRSGIAPDSGPAPEGG